MKPINQLHKIHNLDKIHFIPTCKSNSSKQIIASTTDRIKMLEKSITNPNYIIDNREIIRGGTSFMIDTIKSISEEYPGDNLYLIMGSDTLELFPQWKKYTEILEICNIIVTARISNNHPGKVEHSLKSFICEDLTIFHSTSYGKIYLEETSLIDISSSEVRKRLIKNQDISNDIKPELAKWLLDNKIY